MSRVDVPTLKCDRCQWTTQDLGRMTSFRELQHWGMSGSKDSWDMCPDCWNEFLAFMNGDTDAS